VTENANVQRFPRRMTIDPGATGCITAIDNLGNSHVITTDRYYHDIEMDKFDQWHKDTVQNSGIGHLLPILRRRKFTVSSANDYRLASVARITHMEAFDDFYNDNQYRKWRFRRHKKKQQAFARYAKELTNGDRNIAIGYGNWNNLGPCRGKKNRKAPVVSFGRFLATQVDEFHYLDEYRSSKMCSDCTRGEMEKEVLPSVDDKGASFDMLIFLIYVM
jgi:hypothetical protein